MSRMVQILVLIFASQLAYEAQANYQAAQQFYQRKDFVRAAGAFFQAYSYPKDRAERAKAEWGLAESLRNVGLLYSASKYYSVIVRRGPSKGNPFFRQALEALGTINSTISLGQSHIVKLFKTKVDPSYVPGPARGFFFYYLGVEAYSRKRYERAARYFKQVPAGSPYNLRAQFHLGVVSNLSGRHSQAIDYFERVLAGTGGGRATREMREAALLNIARVHYETRRYRLAIKFYRQVPRDSYDNWLDSLWEASWAFFLMQNHNATLGNIHTIQSPFFIDRFYPETYILQAITFLKLCKYREVKDSLRRFRNRYKGVFRDVNSMLGRYQGNPKGFFRLVYDFKVSGSSRYRNAESILDKLSRTDVYKEAGDTIRFSDRELARLGRFRSYWRSSGLEDELQSFLTSKKVLAQSDAGRRLRSLAMTYFTYLKELSDQTGLILAEMLEGNINRLRTMINVKGNTTKKVQFVGGMEELNVAQRYEYWPFEQEYWEDELGYYVYNVRSQCAVSRGKKK